MAHLSCLFLQFIYIISCSSSPSSHHNLKFGKLLDSGLANAASIKQLQQSPFTTVTSPIMGLSSKQNFKLNDVIVEIPIESTLMANEVVGKRMECIEQLAFQLVKEWELNGKSKFATYIDLLPEPKQVGTPYYWSDEMLTHCPYPLLTKSIQNQRKKWVEIARKYAPQGISEERFIWAMEIVASRAFTGVSGTDSKDMIVSTAASAVLVGVGITVFQYTHNEILAGIISSLAVLLSVIPSLSGSAKATTTVLLPIIDSCNHKSVNPEGVLSFEPTRNAFVVRAARDIEAETQIFISYGHNRDNDDLLQYFGFVEVDCPADRFVVLNPLNSLEMYLKRDGDVPTTESSSILNRIQSIRDTPGFTDSPMIITRNDKEEWKLGGLTLLAGSNSSSRDFIVNKISKDQKEQLEKNLSLFTATNILKEKDPKTFLIIKTFLEEKMKLLEKISRD